MSNFLCDKCGIANIDSPTGYVAGCQHYPPEHGRYVVVSFGGDTFDGSAFYDGIAWFTSAQGYIEHRAVHPVAWRAK